MISHSPLSLPAPQVTLQVPLYRNLEKTTIEKAPRRRNQPRLPPHGRAQAPSHTHAAFRPMARESDDLRETVPGHPGPERQTPLPEPRHQMHAILGAPRSPPARGLIFGHGRDQGHARAVIGTHHHISGRHLHAYANEMAWREDNRRISNGEQFLMIVGASLAHSVSREWKGYWQRRMA